VGKPEGRRPLGRPSRKWEAIKIYLKEKECETMDRIIRLREGTSGTLQTLAFHKMHGTFHAAADLRASPKEQWLMDLQSSHFRTTWKPCLTS
jgi:hypothetical protein